MGGPRAQPASSRRSPSSASSDWRAPSGSSRSRARSPRSSGPSARPWSASPSITRQYDLLALTTVLLVWGLVQRRRRCGPTPARRRRRGVARRPVAGRRHRGGAADALPGGAAGRRRRPLRPRRRPAPRRRTAGGGRGGRPCSAWPPARSSRPSSRPAGAAPSRRERCKLDGFSVPRLRREARRDRPTRSAGSSPCRPGLRRRGGRGRRPHRPARSSRAPGAALVARVTRAPGRAGGRSSSSSLVTAGGVCLQNLLFLSMPPRISARYLAMAWPFVAFLPLLLFGLWPRATLRAHRGLLPAGAGAGDHRRAAALRGRGPPAARRLADADAVLVDNVGVGELPRFLWFVPGDAPVFAGTQEQFLADKPVWADAAPVGAGVLREHPPRRRPALAPQPRPRTTCARAHDVAAGREQRDGGGLRDHTEDGL